MSRLTELETHFIKKAAEYRSKRLRGDFADCIFEQVPCYIIEPKNDNIHELDLLNELTKVSYKDFMISILEIRDKKVIIKLCLL